MTTSQNETIVEQKKVGITSSSQHIPYIYSFRKTIKLPKKKERQNLKISKRVIGTGSVPVMQVT